MKKSKMVLRWIEKHPHIVAGPKDYDREHHDCWDHWVYLRPGWISSQGTHMVHELNVRDTLYELNEVEPCSCDDCRSYLYKGVTDAYAN